MHYKIKATGEITDALGVYHLRSNEYEQVYDCLLCGKCGLKPACAECDDFVEEITNK